MRAALTDGAASDPLAICERVTLRADAAGRTLTPFERATVRQHAALLRARAADLLARADDSLALADAEGRDLSGDEAATARAWLDERDAIGDTLARLNR